MWRLLTTAHVVSGAWDLLSRLLQLVHFKVAILSHHSRVWKGRDLYSPVADILCRLTCPKSLSGETLGKAISNLNQTINVLVKGKVVYRVNFEVCSKNMLLTSHLTQSVSLLDCNIISACSNPAASLMLTSMETRPRRLQLEKKIYVQRPKIITVVVDRGIAQREYLGFSYFAIYLLVLLYRCKWLLER